MLSVEYLYVMRVSRGKRWNKVGYMLHQHHIWQGLILQDFLSLVVGWMPQNRWMLWSFMLCNRVFLWIVPDQNHVSYLNVNYYVYVSRGRNMHTKVGHMPDMAWKKGVGVFYWLWGIWSHDCFNFSPFGPRTLFGFALIKIMAYINVIYVSWEITTWNKLVTSNIAWYCFMSLVVELRPQINQMNWFSILLMQNLHVQDQNQVKVSHLNMMQFSRGRTRYRVGHMPVTLQCFCLCWNWGLRL